MTTTELMSFASEFRKKIRALSKQLVIERLGNMCMGYLDFVALPEDDRSYFTEMNRKLFLDTKAIKQSALFTAYEKMQEMEQRIITEKIKKPEYDFLCDLIFFPAEKYTLVMLFAEQKAYIKALEEMPGVSEHAYWDNKEQPDHLSKVEWMARKSRWENAMGDTGIPSLEGLSVSAYTQLPFIDPEVIHEYIMDRFNLENRVNNYAGKIVVLDQYWKIVVESNEMFGTEKMYKEAAQYLKTAEGQKHFAIQSERLKDLFVDHYSLEDLSRPLEHFVNTN